MTANRPPVFWTAAAAAAAMILGSFVPWATLLGFSTSGTEGGDGWIVIGCAVVAALVLWRWSQGKGGIGWGLAAGAIGLIVGIVNILDVNDTNDEFGGLSEGISVGWGLWLVTIASAALLVSLVLLRRETAPALPADSAATQPPPPPPAA